MIDGIFEWCPIEDVTDESDSKFPILIEETYIPKGSESIEEEKSSSTEVDEG